MVNKIILAGNLGKDPEVKSTSNDKSFCKCSLATNESYKDQSGEWQQKTTWHNLLIWGKSGDNFGSILSKGDLVYIEGKIDYGKPKEGGGNPPCFVVVSTWKRMTKVERAGASLPDVGTKEGDDDLPF